MNYSAIGINVFRGVFWGYLTASLLLRAFDYLLGLTF